MSAGSKHLVIALIVITVLFAASIPLTDYIGSIKPPLPKGYEDDDLSLQASRIKGFAFGAEGLIADWYWMNSLQYIGGKISKVGLDQINLDDLRGLNPRLLYPMLNNTTDLDPRFIAAYSYGATVLPAIDVDQAIALTEKGIANNPENWRLYHYLGYIHWRKKDYERASEAYAAGSRVPDAAPFMREMAAAMRTRGGSREIARQMYLQIFEEADDQQSKSNAELRLMEIDSLDEREAINNALSSIREARGNCPARLSDVIPMLRTVSLPRGRSFSLNDKNELVDPTGSPYRFDRENCKADLDLRSRIPRTLE